MSDAVHDSCRVPPRPCTGQCCLQCSLPRCILLLHRAMSRHTATRCHVQEIYAQGNLPAVILLAMDSVNPNDCTAALGLLVKLLVPEYGNNELFAQQYMQVRLQPWLQSLGSTLNSYLVARTLPRSSTSVGVAASLFVPGGCVINFEALKTCTPAGWRPQGSVCAKDVP
jgi:hypothetical protein